MEGIKMAREFPKIKAWSRIYAELSKIGSDADLPPVPKDSADDWQRNLAWEKTQKWAAKNNASHCFETLSDEDYYASSPFSNCNTQRETFSGEVGKILRDLNEQKRWTKSKYELVKRLISVLKENGYISFSGHGSTYPTSTVGSSFICDVPLNKQGNLKPFRGQIIRVVCTGSGIHSHREYMAGLYSAQK